MELILPTIDYKQSALDYRQEHYKGAYKDIEIAYTALMAYMAENRLESTGVYYDYYLNNPADTPESELLTQVVFPIK